MAYSVSVASVDDEWVRFVDDSPFSAVYFRGEFLLSLSRYEEVGLYKVRKGSALRAIVVVPGGLDGGEPSFNPLIYSGVCFGPVQNNQSIAAQNSERFEILSEVSSYLVARYAEFRIQLAPDVVDIRPFQWINYGLALPKPLVGVKYTSLIDLRDADFSLDTSENSLYSRCSSSRRQQIRYAKRDGLVFEESEDIDGFLDCYEQVMSSSEDGASPRALEGMRDLIAKLLTSGAARMFISSDPSCDRPGAYAVFGIQGGRAYYLYGASVKGVRGSSCGTWVLWQAFHRLSKMGVSTVDLEGINSPARGWFKTSFGGSVTPYFTISFTA